MTSSDLHIDFRAGIGGGLFAARPIRKDEIIASFDGEIHRWSLSTREIPNTPPDFARDHCVQIGEGVSRDAGGIARLANHSCDPNVFFDTTKMEVVCMKQIQPGEELRFFYPSTEWEMDQPFVCNCGSSNCLQLINGAAHLSDETLAQYRLSDFIKRQVHHRL